MVLNKPRASCTNFFDAPNNLSADKKRYEHLSYRCQPSKMFVLNEASRYFQIWEMKKKCFVRNPINIIVKLIHNVILCDKLNYDLHTS